MTSTPRLDPDDKDGIARAAELGVTLSAEAARRFLATMEKPFKPNARLRKAMDRGLVRR